MAKPHRRPLCWSFNFDVSQEASSTRASGLVLFLPQRLTSRRPRHQILGSMDEEAIQEVLDQVPMYQAARITTYAYLFSYTALIYHYITTIDQEVEHIWSQPRWKLGKIFFLTTRYSALIVMAHDLHAELRQAKPFVGISVARTSAEATLWLCLYALLEGKLRYFYLMVLMLVGFTIPIQVLQNISTFAQKPIPLGPLDEYLGFPCSFLPPEHMNWYIVAAYLSFTRTLVATVLGLVTFTVRYRKQRNNLLKVIKREGGLYLLSSLVLKFVDGLKATPNVTIEDKYDIAWGLSWLLINVFAERLLLSMKQVDHPGTRAVISTLVFNVEDELPRRRDGPYGASLVPKMIWTRFHTCWNLNGQIRTCWNSRAKFTHVWPSVLQFNFVHVRTSSFGHLEPLHPGPRPSPESHRTPI
ncbi:hypothetical protein NMY22_g5874 [Coprinellus aureogranulatus]|nr:hypothetical protein NMY22_g5874 [Coprinellus aureogranulatus]